MIDPLRTHYLKNLALFKFKLIYTFGYDYSTLAKQAGVLITMGDK